MASRAAKFDCSKGHHVPTVKRHIRELEPKIFRPYNLFHTMLQSEQKQTDEDGKISLPSEYHLSINSVSNLLFL